MADTMAKPKPVPGDWGSWLNRSKTMSATSGATPGPVSRTQKSIVPPLIR